MKKVWMAGVLALVLASCGEQKVDRVDGLTYYTIARQVTNAANGKNNCTGVHMALPTDIRDQRVQEAIRRDLMMLLDGEVHESYEALLKSKFHLQEDEEIMQSDTLLEAFSLLPLLPADTIYALFGAENSYDLETVRTTWNGNGFYSGFYEYHLMPSPEEEHYSGVYFLYDLQTGRRVLWSDVPEFWRQAAGEYMIGKELMADDFTRSFLLNDETVSVGLTDEGAELCWDPDVSLSLTGERFMFLIPIEDIRMLTDYLHDGTLPEVWEVK